MDITQHITSGEATVVASGTAMTFFGKPVTVSIRDGRLEPVTVRFEFLPKQVDQPPGMQGETEGKNTLVLKLTGFDNILGTGTTKPLAIGTLLGDHLHLSFWVIAMGNDTSERIIHYSFFTTKEAVK